MGVKILHNGVEYYEQAKMGESLMSVMRRSGIPAEFPCGGNHICGKCRVLTDSIGLTPCNENEKLLIGDQEGVRLACFAKIRGECTIEIESSKAPCVEMEGENKEYEADPIYEGDYGMAFDIGTTTIAGYLFSAESIRPAAAIGEVNIQRTYGADVISRVQFCVEKGINLLSNLIKQQINDMMVKLCEKAGIGKEEIRMISVCGNTVMLHLFAGLHPASIAVAPFKAPTLFGYSINPCLRDFPWVEAYLPKCAASYVGADIVCAILASGIMEKKKSILLIDIGTNGEMGLWHKENLYCCSTAAGPAFEGAGISCGSGATPGAICNVGWKDDKLTYKTIQNQQATGICGSGIIDVMAVAILHGLIEYNGKIKNPDQKLFLSESLFLNQEDIRKIQYAKGAIRGGIETLLNKADITAAYLEEIILCGGFGANLDPVSAETIGLLPEGSAQKTLFFGNGAGVGVGQILQSKEKRKAAEAIAESAKVVELSFSPFFMEKYVEHMNFKNQSLKLI